MSGAARANKVSVAVVRPSEDPSTMRVNMKKHEMKGEVGKKIHFQGHGMITGMNHDKYGHTMDVEVHHLENTKGDSNGRTKAEEKQEQGH